MTPFSSSLKICNELYGSQECSGQLICFEGHEQVLINNNLGHNQSLLIEDPNMSLNDVDSYELCCAYCVPSTVLSTLNATLHLIVTIIPEGRNHRLCLSGKETEAPKC